MADVYESSFTWIPFYQEFADKLLGYKDNRHDLIELVQEAYSSIGMRMPKLDADGVPTDIDPFTVFGLFNKGLTWSNRINLASSLGSLLGVSAPVPSDFDGIPVLMKFAATYYAFSDDSRRKDGDIDRLWDTFVSALAFADNPGDETREAFIAAYDASLHQYGIGWKLTIGLFYARPNVFINLDSRNRWFLTLPNKMTPEVNAKAEKLKAAPGAEEYLGLCDCIRDALQTRDFPYKTFPELSLHAWGYSEEINQQNKEEKQADEPNALGDAEVETVHYWLYAPGEGARMWDEFYERGVMGLGWDELGDLSAYETKEDMRLRLQELNGSDTSQKNSAHANWQFVHDVKPGDVVFAKKGRSEILGRGIVTGDYVYDPNGGDYASLRDVEWTNKGHWTLNEMFAMKTLTDVTDYTDFVAKLNALFESETDEVIEEEPAVEYPAYGKEDFLRDVFIDKTAYDTLVGVLRAKKNIILQGAPGVGKTFVAKRLAYSMMGVKDASRVMMVQFHQSFSYEDFIEGFRPTLTAESKSGFDLVKGAFYTFCKKAQDDDENDYFFIIDEINRGNLSKIFGELFMLIENDKRGAKNKLQLLYSRELFYVPTNVYLIGMMNTADRSLAMLDYALRRRFAFFDLKPGFGSDGFVAYREGLDNPKFNKLVACVEGLNRAIAEDDTLGEGFCIGHSYFCNLESDEVNDAKLSAIVEYELIPMLREYWFDEPSKVREWADNLRRSLK